MDPDEFFAHMRAQMAAAERLHAAELAELLLRVCRAAGAELRAGLEDLETSDRKNAIVDDLRQFFDSARSVILTRAVLDQLAERIDRYARDAGKAVASRAVAEALDQQFGKVFYQYFARSRSLQVRENCAFPIVPSRNHKLVHGPSGNPAIRRLPFDTLNYMRLGPADMRGLQIELAFCDRDLPELTAETVFGVGVVGNSIEDEYEWDRYGSTQHMFFGVRPKDPEAHRSRLRHVLSAIERAQPQVVVLPELCLTDELFGELECERALRDIPLLVLGSRHSPVGTQGGRNITSIYARGRLLGEHRKFRPVHFEDDLGPDGSRLVRQEHLVQLSSRLTILSSPHLTEATAICKDAIDPDVWAAWRHVGADLLLLPVMSKAVEDFCKVADNLAADPQAFTVIANTGGTPVLFGRPVRDNRVISVDSVAPRLVLLDVNGRER